MNRHEKFRKELDEKFGGADVTEIKVAIMTLKELSKIKERLDELEAANK